MYCSGCNNVPVIRHKWGINLALDTYLINKASKLEKQSLRAVTRQIIYVVVSNLNPFSLNSLRHASTTPEL